MTVGTVEKILKIFARLAKNNLDVGGDFQCFVTPDGSPILIDGGSGISTLPHPNNHPSIIFNFLGCLNHDDMQIALAKIREVSPDLMARLEDFAKVNDIDLGRGGTVNRASASGSAVSTREEVEKRLLEQESAWIGFMDMAKAGLRNGVLGREV